MTQRQTGIMQNTFKLCALCAFVALYLTSIFYVCAVWAANDRFASQWGGQIKTQGSVSWPDDESIFQVVGTRPYYDGNVSFRLKNQLFYSDWISLETHYEAVLSGGDTRQKVGQLEQRYPDFFSNGSTTLSGLNDERRLMDLTRTVEQDDRYIFYHRLDRFVLTLQPTWGVLRIGRQALTWGNGLLFNPMDLFNPFSPTDIERDYKVGDDMISLQLFPNESGDFQFLYVPRRDLGNHNVELDQSSLAGKLHFSSGTTEFDIMAARHYKDKVVGIGSTGYLWDAAWRLDAIWTFLQGEADKNNFLSVIANLDYSWIWWNKNIYGFIEFYYNGLGNDDPSQAYIDPLINERFLRGEMFTFGRTYLSEGIQVEVHPLFKIYLTVITNLSDSSGIVQPRAVWDLAKNIQLTFGSTIGYGGVGTEFGGFHIPQTAFLHKSPDNAYIWFTLFF